MEIYEQSDNEFRIILFFFPICSPLFSPFFFLKFTFFYLFIYLFIYDCVESSFLREGFL